jgi:acetolactate decarboxylase
MEVAVMERDRSAFFLRVWGGALCALLLFSAGCATAPLDTVSQYSTIDALLAGGYDGSITLEKMLDYGDLGLGTFDKLEGEMVVLDGEIYQVLASGEVKRPPLDETTPFFNICHFSPDNSFKLPPVTKSKTLKRIIDGLVANPNLFYAIRIEGTFKTVKARSVPAQKKPYKPLLEVVKHQSVFTFKNIEGVIVGFRGPKFIKGVGVPGYHLHFISKDGKKGGHVLDFELSGGNCAIDQCDNFLLRLPTRRKYFPENIESVPHDALDQVERNKH